MRNSVPASDRFHSAIKSGAKQRALVYFFDDNLYFTNDDLTSSGIHYENYFNTEEDLSISGTPPSATISFSVFNENHRLDNMSFGRFKASIAAMVATKTHNRVGNVSVEFEGDVLSGHDEFPYFRSNGEGVSEQPDFSVKSILVRDGLVYCVGLSGQVIIYKKNATISKGSWGTVSRHVWSQISEMSWSEILNLIIPGGSYEIYNNGSIDQIMIPSVIRYAERNIGIVVLNDNTIEDYLKNGIAETYEYVDLGIFYANRPARVKTNVISVDGYDAMVKFDVSTENMSIAFPITLKSLLDTVCAFVGIKHKVSSFINEDIVIDENSDIFQSSTARDVIGYIAEAACSVPKIDYDGVLAFSWWTDSDLIIDENDYSTFVSNEYSVKRIDRLQIRSTENDVGILVGSGTNGYVIQENPFLNFKTHDEGVSRAQSIYDRLTSFDGYTPGSAKWFADWSYRPGDVITIMSGGVAYRYPIFGYALDWSGLATANLESTGNEKREVLDAKHRESFAVGRKMLEIEKTIEGIKIIASDAKTESGEAYSKISEFELTVDGYTSEVSSFKKSVDGYAEATAKYEASVNGYSAELKDYKESVDGYAETTANYKAAVDGFSSEVSNYKESVIGYEKEVEEYKTSLTQTSTEISAKVSKDDIINQINLSTEEAQIKAPKIKFDGAVITNGTLETGNWKFDNNGSNYNGNGIGVNMTILNGEFVGGDSYGTRAFYGSTNCDAQYGSDYDYDTYIRAGAIKLITHKDLNGHSSLNTYGSAYCRLSSGGEFSFLCGESSSGDPRGNIGSNSQRWDTVYVNALHQGSSKYVKHDIQSMRDMGDVIDGLRPVTFVYNNDKNNKIQYGLVYEEAIEVFPHICLPSKSGDVNDIGIDYTRLIAPMLKEIQSLRERVKALEERM